MQRAPLLPTEDEQFAARKGANTHLADVWFWGFAMGVWSLTVSMVQLAQPSHVPPVSWQMAQLELPVTSRSPNIRVALEDDLVDRRANRRTMMLNDVETDTVTLANHVLKELVADELQSIALKLSLGGKVAHHAARQSGITLPVAEALQWIRPR